MRRLLLALLLPLIVVTTAARPARAQPTDAILDSLQYTAFRFFWDEANPANGLIKDRSTPDSPCSIASTGFGLSAINIGVERGYVDRVTAAQRVLTTLRTFWTGPQGPEAAGVIGYQGWFYHFLGMNTATRTWDCELSSIDTALLLAGILDSRMFFDGAGSTEDSIRALADSIYHRVDWDFMRNNATGIMMGWKPVGGFSSFGRWRGYNEAMILYLLEIGSPVYTLPINPRDEWNFWVTTYSWQTLYGQTYIVFPPLFGHQYTHCWVNFRGIRDGYGRFRGLDYFENSRRATYAQQAYCIANPLGRLGYSKYIWGLTAGDGPTGYNARGAPPTQNDDGTITPTAAIASIPFAPEIVVPTIRYWWTNFKESLWGPYGFRDGFNLGAGWWATDVIGIDQGPIIMMIENYRSGSVWSRMMANPDIQRGLTRANFQTVAVDAGGPPPAGPRISLAVEPNPFRDGAAIRFRLPSEGAVRVTVFDVSGREVARPVDGVRRAGEHSVRLEGMGLPAGVYEVRLDSPEGAVTRKGVRIR